MIVDPGPVTGSEDVGTLATEARAPCVYMRLEYGNGAITIEPHVDPAPIGDRTCSRRS